MSYIWGFIYLICPAVEDIPIAEIKGSSFQLTGHYFRNRKRFKKRSSFAGLVPVYIAKTIEVDGLAGDGQTKQIEVRI